MENLEQISELIELPQVHLPLILLGGIIAGWIAHLFIRLVLGRLVERTSISFDDKLVNSIRMPVVLSIFLGSCYWAIHLCELGETSTQIAKNILITLAAVSWTSALLQVSTLVLEALSEDKRKFQFVQPRTKPLLLMVSNGLILAAALYYISLVWNADVTAWIASAGIAGIAIGFAAKDTLANLIAGIAIIADRPYQINDYVVLSDGSVRGRVTRIGLRSTRILTRDDIEVILPNAVIANSMIVNESGGPYEKYRIAVNVDVAYGSDTDKVCELLLKVAEDESLVVKYPEPRIRFRAFGESGLNFDLLVWIAKPEFRGQALHELNTMVHKAFNQNNIEIPFPKRDLYLRNPEVVNLK